MARLTLRGAGAAPGITEGWAWMYGPDAAAVARQAAPAPVPEQARRAEVERWRRALDEAAAQLAQIQARIGERIGEEQATVFEAQALFLQDPALLEPVEAAVRDEGLPARTALERVWEAAARELDAIDDPYLRARATDLRDVERRVARLLEERDGGAHLREHGDAPLRPPEPESIVVARDLAPSEIASLESEALRGIVLAEGTPTAHVAILARGMGLPLVVGVGDAIRQIEPGRALLLDGSDGTVLVDPDLRDRAHYARRAGTGAPARQGTMGYEEAELAAVTRDGHRIALLANAGCVADARKAREQGAEGIGLLRTEFLLGRLATTAGEPPDEEALAEAYGAVMAVMGDRPLVVRAMDVGGDKPVAFLDVGHEANPFLGWRGIRVLLDRPDLFVGQVRALLRAAARHHADVRLLLPMVSDLDELRAARRLIATTQAELGIERAQPLRIGAMIEVPAAALIAEALAREADFFSLGTNDLVQYALACDRGNARVRGLYQPLHPAALRLVAMTVRAAHAAGRPVSVCGEAAGDLEVAPVLIGLGVDELSVAPDRLAAIRAQVRALRFERLTALAAEALTQATVAQVREVLTGRPA